MSRLGALRATLEQAADLLGRLIEANDSAQLEAASKQWDEFKGRWTLNNAAHYLPSAVPPDLASRYGVGEDVVTLGLRELEGRLARDYSDGRLRDLPSRLRDYWRAILHWGAGLTATNLEAFRESGRQAEGKAHLDRLHVHLGLLREAIVLLQAPPPVATPANSSVGVQSERPSPFTIPTPEFHFPDAPIPGRNGERLVWTIGELLRQLRDFAAHYEQYTAAMRHGLGHAVQCAYVTREANASASQTTFAAVAGMDELRTEIRLRYDAELTIGTVTRLIADLVRFGCASTVGEAERLEITQAFALLRQYALREIHGPTNSSAELHGPPLPPGVPHSPESLTFDPRLIFLEAADLAEATEGEHDRNSLCREPDLTLHRLRNRLNPRYRHLSPHPETDGRPGWGQEIDHAPGLTAPARRALVHLALAVADMDWAIESFPDSRTDRNTDSASELATARTRLTAARRLLAAGAAALWLSLDDRDREAVGETGRRRAATAFGWPTMPAVVPHGLHGWGTNGRQLNPQLWRTTSLTDGLAEPEVLFEPIVAGATGQDPPPRAPRTGGKPRIGQRPHDPKDRLRQQVYAAIQRLLIKGWTLGMILAHLKTRDGKLLAEEVDQHIKDFPTFTQGKRKGQKRRAGDVVRAARARLTPEQKRQRNETLSRKQS